MKFEAFRIRGEAIDIPVVLKTQVACVEFELLHGKLL
jgi:hypothetical protein